MLMDMGKIRRSVRKGKAEVSEARKQAALKRWSKTVDADGVIDVGARREVLANAIAASPANKRGYRKNPIYA